MAAGGVGVAVPVPPAPSRPSATTAAAAGTRGTAAGGRVRWGRLRATARGAARRAARRGGEQESDGGRDEPRPAARARCPWRWSGGTDRDAALGGVDCAPLDRGDRRTR